MKRRLPINRQNVLLLAAGAILAIGGVFIVQEVQNMPQPLRYQDKGVTIQWLPQSVKRWSKDMDTMGKKYNVDPNLLAIIMTIESGGNPKANSGVATGLMQITK
ncbi:MAG TPA: transglycosylase SLT domain-containing protein, partial [Candidatus Saccharibacteria bacterium]|nr:transglycosylase SLT domain-containing protein [Candidatus Saccharibacteria bacterium]